jgi:hypothetical protein
LASLCRRSPALVPCPSPVPLSVRPAKARARDPVRLRVARRRVRVPVRLPTPPPMPMPMPMAVSTISVPPMSTLIPQLTERRRRRQPTGSANSVKDFRSTSSAAAALHPSIRTALRLPLRCNQSIRFPANPLLTCLLVVWPVPPLFCAPLHASARLCAGLVRRLT